MRHSLLALCVVCGCGGVSKRAVNTAADQVLLDTESATASVAICRSGASGGAGSATVTACDDAVARLNSVKTTVVNLKALAK
jgi:hypothetical protein